MNVVKFVFIHNLTLISDPSDQLECLLRVIDECIILKDYIKKYYIIIIIILFFYFFDVL